MNRQIKAYRKRAVKASTEKLEKLAAAFLKETGLKASQARLCQTTGLKDGLPVMELWFEPLPERANLADAHPDVQYQADLLFSINEFTKHKPMATWDDEDRLEVQGWLQMVSEHLQKYADLDATSVLGATNDRAETQDPKADQQTGELVQGNAD